MTSNDRPDTSAKTLRAGVPYILITVALQGLATGVIIPVFPQLIATVARTDIAQTAQLFGLFFLTFAVTQLFAAPITGSLSDSIGRRPVIVFSNIALAIDCIIMALAPTLWLLFVGRVISAAAAATNPAGFAYLADVQPPERRAISFAMAAAAAGIGLAAGPLIGGVVGTFWGSRAPFWVAGAITLVNGLYGTFILPESLPRERRVPLRLSMMNPFGVVGGLLWTYPAVAAISVGSFLLYLGSQVFNSLTVVYTSYRFGWDPSVIGIFVAVTSLMSIGVQLAVVPFAIRRVGDFKAFMAGTVFLLIGVPIMGYAPLGWPYWAGALIAGFGAVTGPALAGLISNLVKPEDQGRLAGTNASLFSLTTMIGPIAFTQIFALTISQTGPSLSTGTPYFVAAAMFGASSAVVAMVMAGAKQKALGTS